MSSQVPGSVAEAEIEADAAEADVDAQNHADEPDMVKEQELMDHLARTHDERRSKDGSADVETLEKHLTKAVRFSRAESTTQPPKADPLFGAFEWSPSDNVSTPPDSPLDDDELESPMERMRRVVSRKVMPMVSAVSIFTDKSGSTNALAIGTGTSAATDSTATVHPPASAHSEHTDKDDSNNPRGLTGSESENSVATPHSRSDGSQRRRLSFQAAAGAVRFGANIFKGPWNSSSKTENAEESTDAGQGVAKERFNPSKALQKAAHKLTVTRAFQVNMISAAKRDMSATRVLQGPDKMGDSLSILKSLLSSDKDNQDLIDLTFDRRKLSHEMKQIIRKDRAEQLRREKKEKERIAQARKDKIKERRAAHRSSDAALMRNSSQWIDAVDSNDADFDEVTEEERKKVLGYGMTKEEFLAMIEGVDPIAKNQLVVARLMQVLSEQTREGEDSSLAWMRRYKCIEPEGTFMNCWTFIFVLLVSYICTVGLLISTFDLDVNADQDGSRVCSWSPISWFDLAVDTFFVIDIIGRLFFFGQSERSVESWSGGYSDVILEPDKVLVNYVRGGFLLDLITGFPIQWIIMAAYSPCASAGNISTLRLLRIFRVTRVLKLLQQPLVKKYARALRRRVGNNHILQAFSHITLVFFFNHVWSCLSWLIQGLDQSDLDGDGRTGFEEWQDARDIQDSGTASRGWGHHYSCLFQLTMQQLFAIEPYHADQPLEAWFGTLTLCLAVFINATMLSKILEIWTALNKRQTDLDNRLNSVMAFLRANGIVGDLRHDILDYFEFRYSTSDDLNNDRVVLDQIPSEMQARVIHKMFPNALNESFIFSGSNDGFVAQCVLRMSKNSLRTMPDQVITAQGAMGDEMYLMHSGAADVSIKDNGGPMRVVGRIAVGQCFGEISLWIECKRSATVTATEFSQLFILTRDDMNHALQRFPEMEATIAANALAACLRVSSMSPAVRGISSKTSERLARRMAFSKRDFENGACMVEAGKPAKAAFIIRTGRVVSEVLHGRLEVLSEMRCVGLTELFAQKPYQETIRAKGLVQAYRLTDSDVTELLDTPEEDEYDYRLAQLRESARSYYETVNQAHIGMRWNLLKDDLLQQSEPSDPSEAPSADATGLFSRVLLRRGSTFSSSVSNLTPSAHGATHHGPARVRRTPSGNSLPSARRTPGFGHGHGGPASVQSGM